MRCILGGTVFSTPVAVSVDDEVDKQTYAFDFCKLSFILIVTQVEQATLEAAQRPDANAADRY
jgi:hypothetical protein